VSIPEASPLAWYTVFAIGDSEPPRS
jgi:hypothetical protein